MAEYYGAIQPDNIFSGRKYWSLWDVAKLWSQQGRTYNQNLYTSTLIKTKYKYKVIYINSPNIGRSIGQKLLQKNNESKQPSNTPK
jgi:hypothetical protein